MFFVTKMDNEAFLGSTLINAKSYSDYFAKVKQVINQEFGKNKVAFVTLNELYDTLRTADTQEVILLSKYAKAYKQAILTKYPSATVKVYEFEDDKPVQPNPNIFGH